MIQTRVSCKAKAPCTAKPVISGIQLSIARTPSITQAKAIISGISPASAKVLGKVLPRGSPKPDFSGRHDDIFHSIPCNQYNYITNQSNHHFIASN